MVQCTVLAFTQNLRGLQLCLRVGERPKHRNVFWKRHRSHLHMIWALLPVSVSQEGVRGAELPTSQLKVQLLRKPQGSRAPPLAQSSLLRQRVRILLRSNTSNPLIGAQPNFFVCFAPEANSTKPQTDEATTTTGKNLFFSPFFLPSSTWTHDREGMEWNSQCADTRLKPHSVANPGWWSRRVWQADSAFS